MEVFEIFSADEVLNHKIRLEDIEGNIVLLGSFNARDHDAFFTPLNIEPDIPDMFGVVYIANVVAQILDQAK